MIEKTYTDEDGDRAYFYLGRATPRPEARNTVRITANGGDEDLAAFLTDDNLRDLRAAIDEHLGDRPKPTSAMQALQAEVDRMLARPVTWTLPDPRPSFLTPPPSTRTRAEEIVYDLAEFALAAMKESK